MLGKLDLSLWLQPILSSYRKINSKWLKDLNIRHETIKLPKEIIGKAFSDVHCTNVFLGKSPEAIEIKTMVNGT